MVEGVLFLLLVAMTIIVFLQVLFRYVINLPLFWSEEAARYIMIWIVYLGASVGLKRGAHLGFTYVLDKVNFKLARVFVLLSNLGVLAFCLHFVYYGLIIAMDNANQMTPAIGMPFTVVYLVLPVSGILCIIQLLPIIHKTLKQLREREVQRKGKEVTL